MLYIPDYLVQLVGFRQYVRSGSQLSSLFLVKQLLSLFHAWNHISPNFA